MYVDHSVIGGKHLHSPLRLHRTCGVGEPFEEMHLKHDLLEVRQAVWRPTLNAVVSRSRHRGRHSFGLDVRRIRGQLGIGRIGIPPHVRARVAWLRLQPHRPITYARQRGA